MDLAIVNASTLVSEGDARAIAIAIDEQLKEDVLPAWDRRPCSCIFLLKDAPVPAGVLPIRLLDDADDPSALGYHDESPEGFIAGKVFCRPILDAGGGVLNPGWNGDSISAVASHEAIEAKFDPNVNAWVDGIIVSKGAAYTSTAIELCDAVQAGTYSKRGVLVSDFLLRAWFDPNNSKGPYNWLGTLKAPLTLDRGGYAIVRAGGPGSEAEVFGAEGDLRPWRVAGRSAGRYAA